MNKDIYEYITNFADNRVVLNMLSVNKQFRDEQIFKRVMERRYPFISFGSDNKSWKRRYIEIIFYIEEIERMIGYKYSKTSKKHPRIIYNIILVGDLFSLFIQASSMQELDLVKFLVEKRGINVRVFNDLAVRNAAENNRFDMLKYLVEHDANIHTYNDAPLFSAIRNGNLETVKYLVEHGADIHFNNNQALNLAETYQYTKVIEYIKSVI